MKRNNSQNPYIYLEIDKAANRIRIEDFKINTSMFILLLAELLITFCKRKKKNTTQMVETIVKTIYKKYALEKNDDKKEL